VSLLELKSVTKSYSSDSIAVESVDLLIEQGELVALTGESGCGKTTLLRLIAGLEQPDSGSILIEQQMVAGNQVFIPPRNRQIGLVFQDYALFPHMTVVQNIAFGLSSQTKQQRKKKVNEMLKLVELTDYGQRYPHQLSGGQQQRVAIARALAPNPKLLLLDEPFSNLDTLLKDQVRREISSILRKSGTTAILVTHDIQDAMSMADRIAVLRNGKILQIDEPVNLYERPAHCYTASFFGKVNLIPVYSENGQLMTKIGPLALAADSEQGVLCLRPQHIYLHKGKAEGTSAIVQTVTYMGNCQQIELTAANTQLWCMQSLDHQYHPGEQVTVDFDLDDAHVIWDPS